MTCLELINTLTSSKQVQVLDRSGLVELDIATAKWFKKHYNDSHNEQVKYWLDMEVESSMEDNYGRLLITASHGLTKEEQEIEDKKFMEEHDGMTREQVRRKKAREFMGLIGSMAAMGAPYYR